MRLKLPTLSVSLWQFSNCLSLICLSLTWLSWCSSTLWPGKTLLSQLHKKLPMLGYWWNCGRCERLFEPVFNQIMSVYLFDLSVCFRDVLAVCLHIPRWIYSVTDTNKERLSQLEPSASGPSWAFAFHNLQQNNTKPQINTLCWGALSANFTDFSIAETWLSTPPDQQTDEMSHREPSSMMCSIQVCGLSMCVWIFVREREGLKGKWCLYFLQWVNQ